MGSSIYSLLPTQGPDTNQPNIFDMHDITSLRKYLLEHPKSVNDVHELSGMTKLMLVCSYPYNDNSVEFARLLLDTGASINQQTTNGRTALTIAIYNNNKSKNSIKLIKLLLERGANPFLKDTFITPYEYQSIDYACYTNNLEILKLLLHPIVSNDHLLTACRYGSYKCASYLLDNYKFTNLSECLLAACSTLNKVSYKLITKLLYLGASPNFEMNTTNPLLEFLSHKIPNSQVSLVKRLIPKFECHISPILIACSHQCEYDVIKLLVEHGYEINTSFSFNNKTPIMYASEYSNDVVILLLQHGAKYKMT